MMKYDKGSHLFLSTAMAGFVFFSGASICNAGPMVPFKGSFSGSAAFTSQTTVDLAGEGIMNPGGASHNKGTVTIVGPSVCAGGFAVVNQETLTAANGDNIYVSINDESCPVSPNVYSGLGTYEITGGTGRFQNAEGSGQFEGMGDFNAGKFTLSLNGGIRY